MIKTLKIELIYFFTILVVLALILHPDLLSSPLERIEMMTQRGNYLHPLYWAFGFYSVVLIIRLMVKGVNSLKNKMGS